MRLLKRSAYLWQRLNERAYRALAFASRVLNWLGGGEWPQTLCARVALRFSPQCLFCRVVDRFHEQPEHCRSEMEWWLLHKHRRDKP